MSERRRSLFVLLLVLGLILGSVWAVTTRDTKLGLDLQGGVQLVYRGEPTAQQPTVTQQALQRSLDIMRKRVDAFGVSEPELLLSGNNQIEVNLPGVADAERAAQQVGSTAQLFFYDWEANILDESCKTNPDENASSKQPITGFYKATKQAAKCGAKPSKSNSAADAPRFYAFNKISKKALNNGQPSDSQAKALQDLDPKDRANAEVVEVPVGILVVRDQKPTPQSPPPDRFWIIQDHPALSGTDIKNPEQNFDQGTGGTGQPIVTFDFTSKGRSVWQQTTRAIAQRGQDNFIPGQDPQSAYQHFAIVLDNELISAPFIDFQQNPDGIDGRNGSQIQGGFTIASAQRLANLLKTGALPIKLDLISASQVSATLGKQALSQGLVAGIAGFAIVALFMLVFYRVLGVIAVVALVVYAVYFFALIKLIPITLTLPGIAGLILTIGVAADANIVIFERVKEEIRAGRSVAAGIAAGYRKGLSAIIDANVVTFMVAFILFVLATAGVKGFAFVLGIGTIVSFLTAVLLTQAVLGTMARTRMIAHPTALGAGKRSHHWWEHFDFMGASKWFFSASGLILLIGALAVGGKGLNFGIDFKSGTRIKTELVRPADEQAVRSVLAQVGQPDAEIQRLSGQEVKGNNGFQISTNTITEAQRRQIQDRLQQRFGVRAFNFDTIGPVFGQTVARSALIAIIASLIVISAYIALRFEWKYAVPVLISLMHDILITGGVYALTGREVTTSTVAALLTILGYSLYDTIIVFDRIRENVPRMPRAAFSQIVNRSMSEVLARSLATSFSTALPILALLLFGGETLKDFAFALLVGVASGTYSSIFIGSPVLTHWKERETVYERRRTRIAAQFGGSVPAYAVATAGAPADVAPPETHRRPRRLTEPDTPERAVSKQEFDEMVRDLHTDAPPAGTAMADRDPAADAVPEDLVLKDDKNRRDKPKRPRNKRHGRSR
ncbi:MAG: SecD/SecF fusion protein [Solirubrobacteraceae bacterium]|nr:SecD/SecF fusion protein [Solirubrobacteraceae bacterium]